LLYISYDNSSCLAQLVILLLPVVYITPPGAYPIYKLPWLLMVELTVVNLTLTPFTLIAEILE